MPIETDLQRNYGVSAPDPNTYLRYNIPGNDNGGGILVPGQPVGSFESHDPLQGLNKIIHVSESEGSDSNSGSSANPVQSLPEAFNRAVGGDQILLKTGDIWAGDQTIQPLRDLDGPASNRRTVLGWYKGVDQSPQRPVLEIKGVAIDSFNTGISNMMLDGINFRGVYHDPSHPDFNPSQNKTDIKLLNTLTNFTVQDCHTEYIEFVIQSAGGSASNVVFIGNILDKVYANTTSYTQSKRPSLIFLAGHSGPVVFKHNIFDYGGWDETVTGAGANQYNHNFYAQYGSASNQFLYQENISLRASSHGMHQRSGGLCENNFHARCAISFGGGYHSADMANDADYYCVNNVASEGHSMNKGVDACQLGSLCTTALWGIDIYDNGGRNLEAHHNICDSLAVTSWQPSRPSGNVKPINYDNSNRIVQNNNRYYKWANDSEGVGLYSDPGRTLGRYYLKLLGEGKISATSGMDNFDRMASILKARPVGEYPTYEFSAPGINDWVRTGFDLTKYDYTQFNFPVTY